MSLKDTTKGKNTAPISAFINRRNRASNYVCDPWFELQRNGPGRAERRRYEAVWKECTAMDLTGPESLTLRCEYAHFYERMFPERVNPAGTIDEPGIYLALLRDPATVREISSAQRAKEFAGFKPSMLMVPIETVQETDDARQFEEAF